MSSDGKGGFRLEDLNEEGVGRETIPTSNRTHSGTSMLGRQLQFWNVPEIVKFQGSVPKPFPLVKKTDPCSSRTVADSDAGPSGGPMPGSRFYTLGPSHNRCSPEAGFQHPLVERFAGAQEDAKVSEGEEDTGATQENEAGIPEDNDSQFPRNTDPPATAPSIVWKEKAEVAEDIPEADGPLSADQEQNNEIGLARRVPGPASQHEITEETVEDILYKLVQVENWSAVGCGNRAAEASRNKRPMPSPEKSLKRKKTDESIDENPCEVSDKPVSLTDESEARVDEPDMFLQLATSETFRKQKHPVELGIPGTDGFENGSANEMVKFRGETAPEVVETVHKTELEMVEAVHDTVSEAAAVLEQEEPKEKKMRNERSPTDEENHTNPQRMETVREEEARIEEIPPKIETGTVKMQSGSKEKKVRNEWLLPEQGDHAHPQKVAAVHETETEIIDLQKDQKPNEARNEPPLAGKRQTESEQDQAVTVELAPEPQNTASRVHELGDKRLVVTLTALTGPRGTKRKAESADPRPSKRLKRDYKGSSPGSRELRYLKESDIISPNASEPSGRVLRPRKAKAKAEGLILRRIPKCQ